MNNTFLWPLLRRKTLEIIELGLDYRSGGHEGNVVPLGADVHDKDPNVAVAKTVME